MKDYIYFNGHSKRYRIFKCQEGLAACISRAQRKFENKKLIKQTSSMDMQYLSLNNSSRA